MIKPVEKKDRNIVNEILELVEGKENKLKVIDLIRDLAESLR